MREASKIVRAALETQHLAKKLVVVEVLRKANLKALSEGASERVRTLLTDCRAVIANGEGSAVKKMSENRPDILKGTYIDIEFLKVGQDID